MAVIGISGSYGGLNVGDEAILTVAVEQLRATLPEVEIVVFARNADHTRAHHGVDRVVSPRESMKDEITPEVERLDLLLLGGGGILYDSEAHTYLREVVIAQEVGVPTVTFAIGVGPLRDREERQAVQDGMNRMAHITVREASAKRLLEEIGVEVPVVVTADPALLLTPQPFGQNRLESLGIPLDRPLVGMSVREQGAAAPELSEAAYHQLLAEAADFIVERYGASIVFVPMEHADLRESHRVMGRMTQPEHAHLLRGDHSPGEILALMELFEMAVGMRLHFLIFAAVTGTPLIALPYASKVSDFLQSLGLGPRSMVSHTTAGTFLADLDRLWDHRAEQKALLRDCVPALQERARLTAPLVTGMIRRPGGGTAAVA